MTKQKTNKTKKGKQHIGAPVPGGLFQSINLYSIAKGIPKTQVLRDALECWSQREGVDITQLIKEVALQIHNDWLRKKAKDPIKDLEDFEEHLRKWEGALSSKKVDPSIIKKIIENVQI